LHTRKIACFFVRQKLERKSKFMDFELLKSKTLSDLREIAKLAGVKSVTTYKKGELLEILFGLELGSGGGRPAHGHF